MENKIEVVGKIGDTFLACMFFSNQVDVAITPEAGADPARVLQETYDQLARDRAKHAGSHQPALATFDGEAWAGNLAVIAKPVALDTSGEKA